MYKNIKRFDRKAPPVRTKWYLRPLTYLLSAPDTIAHKTKIIKKGFDGIKPPYLLLCNHNAFMDFKVATKAIFPHRANYVVAIDGFIGREKLLRDVGCICKRKFTQDVTLIRNLRKVIENKCVAVIYPEARYSLCGTTAVLPESLGDLCKMLNVNVFTLICHGHHINSPFWNLHNRKVKPTEAEITLQFTPQELKNQKRDDINEKLVAAFQYDDYEWQKQKNIKVTYEKRAEGLHKVLYQCACCKTEYKMASKGDELFCNSCGKRWKYKENGELEATGGETEFSHIPDWYEWERANVKAEVESGTYSSGTLKCHVDSLPNADKFIRLGSGTLIHDINGFKVEVTDENGEKYEMIKDVPSLYSCHIEYEYLGKYGDCVDLNTLDDTWYVYPEDKDFSVTKMALATEELYYKFRRNSNRPCKPGLA